MPRLLSDQNMGFLIMFVAFGISGLTGYYFPNPDQLILRNVLNVVSLMLILFAFWLIGFITSKEGNEWTHLKTVIRIFPSGKPFLVDLFIDEPDPAYMSEVVPAELKDVQVYPYTVRCRKVEVKLEDIDTQVQYDFGNIEKFIALLPEPWTRYFRFHRRQNGADINGAEFTHSHSEVTTAYLAPYEHLTPGESSPYLFFVEGTGEYLGLTRSWHDVMSLIANTDMDEWIKENFHLLYPDNPPAKEKIPA